MGILTRAFETPNPGRIVRLALNPPEGVALKQGALRVLYRAPVIEGGAVLAETRLAVP